jgi:hypothetical protein
MRFFNLLAVAMAFFAQNSGAKTIELKQEFSPVVKHESAELFIPVPMELEGYQKVLSQKHSGNADEVKLVKVGNVKMLHASWKKAVDAKFEVVTKISLQEGRGPQKTKLKKDEFISATAHVQTDGIVKETSDKITGGLATDDEKAEAIYSWIVEKTVRNPDVRGCGLGDVKSTLTVDNLRGKCADLNSLFVGLTRAAGIPARETFGLRVDSSKEFPSLGKYPGDVSKGQHCRAEYYSKTQMAWIPVDPADVRKAILEENLTLDDPKIALLKKKFFGFWEGNWAAFNHGRDFEIAAGDKKVAVNYFMYPLLVSKSSSPDGMNPSEVKYTLTSQVLQ